MHKLEELFEKYSDFELLTMDGFDDCIVGVAEGFEISPKVVYCTDKVINKLMTHHGMTEEEAVEYFNFNQKGAYVGEYTPLFLCPAY